MEHYPYLVIGGGMAAHAAVQGIREIDPHGPIVMFSMENHPPYRRPPLTKALWAGKPLESIWLPDIGGTVDLHLGQKIVSIDTHRREARDDRGRVYEFDQALLATGVSPRQMPYGGERILYFRTLDDYQLLRSSTGQGKKFAIIGGGFIGSELAAALAMNGERVALIFPELGIGGRIFPPGLSAYLNDTYRDKGVELYPEQIVQGIEEQDNRLRILTNSGKTILADQVVAGIGTLPNTSLAEMIGLRLDNGILVDPFLRTSQANIFAAGDVARFYNPTLGMQMRVEHKDNALVMGLHAGRNMALQAARSQLAAYEYLPYFYSDLFDLGYEAVGELDSRLKTVEDWQVPFRKGVVYYMKAGQVRGVLLWNVWDQIEAARQLIARPGPFLAGDLKASSLNLAHLA